MVISAIAAASSGAVKFLPSIATSLVTSAAKASASAAAKTVISGATGVAAKVGTAAVATAAKALPTVIKAVPVVGPAVVGVGKITASIAIALKAATAIIGIGKVSILPILIASLVYYNYDLFDPENRPFNVKTIDPEYDFVIVGGGSAGSVLANRLSEISNWKILLLEAGGHETEISDVPILSLYLHKSKLDWKYRSQPQGTACQAMIDNRCCWTRGKVLGGSSVLNTMLYIRGSKNDYDLWEQQGNSGWGYESILPFFLKSEDQRNPYLSRNKRQHGTGGLLTIQDAPYNTPLGIGFLQAGQEFGYDLLDVNGEQQTGFAFFQFNMRRGSRCSTAKAFIRPIRMRKNFHLALFSHVTRVLVSSESKRAYGVEFIRDGIKQVVYARREVILSAGAIGSPHLLMLSGIGPQNQLQKFNISVIQNLEGVGDNLQDHIAIGGLAWTIDKPVGIKTNRLINLNAALRYAVTESGPLTSSIGLEAVGFVNTKYANKSTDWPDIEFMLTSASLFSDQQAKIAHGLKKDFFDQTFGDLVGKDTFSVLPMILRPKSRGFIKLQSKNPQRYPLLYHNYLTHPNDVKVMREGVKLAVAYGETESLRGQFGARFHHRQVPNCIHLSMFTDEYWECFIRQYTMSIYHYSGTCKMGPSYDKTAVVDPHLRVYGVKGLRVIDASIMPTITSGNIHAPVIMIGEKGADLIKKLWLRD